MFALKIQPVPTNVRVTTVIVTMVFTKKATSVFPIVIKISARVQVHMHPISAQNAQTVSIYAKGMNVSVKKVFS
jgi:hypothetical protein